MNFAQFEEVKENGDSVTYDSSLSIFDVEGVCCVDGLFPLPLEHVSTEYARHAVHSFVDSNQVPLAELLTCRGEDFDPPRFSAAYLAAYLADVSVDEYAQPGKFKRDYLICYSWKLVEYRDRYLSGSAVWGGFNHHDPTRTVPIGATRIVQNRIAYPNLSFSTSMHSESALRSVYEPHAFERFLKLYHLLELDFDHQLVEDIRNLGSDLKGVGQLFSRFERGEIERLKHVIGKCSEVERVAECIRQICSDTRWHPIMKTIFFDYAKSGNPLTDKLDSFEQMLGAGDFTFTSATQYKLYPCKQVASQHANFNKFILDLAAYWIYRIRCCIAHSKIGEYVMQLDDEPFVDEFAERLLRIVLTTVL